MVRAELYPVPVEDFIAKVEDPPPADIQALYEERKNRIANANDPESGFKIPERMRIASVKAEFDKFLAAEKLKVTDEQVSKYYEENKEKFIQPELPKTGSEPTPDDGKQEDASTKPGEGEKKEAEPKGTAQESDSKNGAAPTPPASKAPEGEKQDGAAPEAGKPDAIPEAAKPDAGKTAAPPAAGTTNDGAAVKDDAAVVEPPAAEDDEESQPPGAPEKADAEPKAAPAKPPESAPAGDEKPAAEKQPAGEAPARSPASSSGDTPPSADPAAKPPAEKTEAPAAGDEPAKTPAEGAEAKPITYKPLEEVADQIRGELADRDAARIKMNEQIAAVRKRVDDYRKKAPNSPLRLPQASQLVQGLLLSAETTELVDVYTFAETDLAKAAEESIVEGNFNRTTVLEAAFGPNASRNLYQAVQINSPGADRATAIHLFWPIEHRESRVPTLEEARKDVIRTWKLQQARPLAEKAARELADKARKQPGASLEQSLGEQAFTTEDFNRISFDGRPTQSVTNVEFVDNDFLNAVFGLKVGEFTVALDGSKRNAYVIRLAEEKPSLEDRLDTFMRFSGSSSFLLERGSSSNVIGDWMVDLHKEMQVKWQP
jgi:hypothetical protein